MEVDPLLARRAQEGRPALTAAMSGASFRRWYWLRSELVAFARTRGLPTSGGKIDIADRIALHLDGKPLMPLAPRRRRTVSALPTLEGIIPPAVQCDQRLRAFFTDQIGSSFRFTVRFQRWLHDHAGETYAAAVDSWRALAADRTVTPIAPQFEYNGFTRSYRHSHPGATHAEVTQAWQAQRSKPRS